MFKAGVCEALFASEVIVHCHWGDNGAFVGRSRLGQEAFCQEHRTRSRVTRLSQKRCLLRLCSMRTKKPEKLGLDGYAS
jgi:hypothetical protein